ncbi:hypothetical protein [Flavihumibacter petaseus]|uniref:HEAT repeat domain-containing protein n=1 Tax=Flavihumibacter petaseus NBRC 106054 TaxID=1220578 RepID=A0A0E9MXC5_9BACT|nr:hypothetical protein [Flavihumibacter petaseus]GAO41775.1 hypothetical protein FPE01S_01_07890 [Flavihumibacter petaseus NBRC 106054]
MKEYSGDISMRLSEVLESHNVEELSDCMIILFYQSDPIDSILFPIIERLLSDRWHQKHEEIIGLIWLRDMKDDRFIEPIIAIALDGNSFRPFDDELEPTLRKCVHALKTIGTNRADLAIRQLVDSGNENVKHILDIYR